MDALHVTPIDDEQMQERTPVSAWHWAVPVAISVVINAVFVGVFAGGLSNRVNRAESDINEMRQQAATKDQVYELKQDVREMKSDIKELMKKQQ